MNQIKLVFFDVDGTLLDRQGNYSPELQLKLRELKSGGVKLAVASGRPPFACQFLFEQLGLDDMGLFYTGGLIYRPSTGATLAAHFLPQVLLQQIIQQARQLNLYVEYYHGQGFMVEQPHYIAAEHGRHLRVEPEIASFDQYLLAPEIGQFDRHCTKLLLGEDSDNSNVLVELESRFPDCQFAYASLPSYPNWRFASVIPNSADKNLAFTQLLDYYQLEAEQVMAIGDSQSDRVFINRAGFGVAMANGIEQLKQEADYITADAENNGAYKALCHVFG